MHGHVLNDRGLVDAPLGKDINSRVAIKDCVRPDGAPAQTEYWVERRFKRAAPPGTTNPFAPANQVQPFSLLRLSPLTGRKHQLRIHLAHLGHPIVGDKIYGSDEDLYMALVENRLTPEQRIRLILPYHALHSAEVRFTWHNQEQVFQCLPDTWFTEFLQ